LQSNLEDKKKEIDEKKKELLLEESSKIVLTIENQLKLKTATSIVW